MIFAPPFGAANRPSCWSIVRALFPRNVRPAARDLATLDAFVAKEFRLEVMRTGFRTCWRDHNYATIIDVSKKVPDDVLQEDETLLLWYDQAVTPMEEA